MSKINTDSNRLSMCHRTYEKKIVNTSYIVESVFKTSGPTIADCIKKQVKLKIGEKQNNEKDTNPV